MQSLLSRQEKKIWDTGWAERAATEMIRYAFRDLGLHRIYLKVLADHVDARKFYENCGFDLEGEFRDAIRIKDKYRSMAWYAMLNWKEK